MIVNATVTGKTGPADQITSLVLNNVTRMDFLPGNQAMKLFYGSSQVLDLDMNGITTFTVSISGANGTYTVTLS